MTAPAGAPTDVTCGSFTFQASALTTAPITSDASDPAVEALRRALGDAPGVAKFNAFEVDTTQIRILDERGGQVVLGVGAPDARGFVAGPTFIAVALEQRGAQWEPVDWTECSPRVGGDRPASERPVTWYLTSGDAAPEPDATSIPIEVLEHACASGQSAEGRIREPTIEYRDDAIVVTVSVKPRSGDQDCQGNPPTPYDLKLAEPLGERRLLDGGRVPPAQPPDPEAPPPPISDLPGDALLHDDAGNVTLYVANESTTIDPVELHHIIDGAVIPQAQYRNDAGWIEYRFRLPGGLHQISVAAVGPDGTGQDGLEEFFEVTGHAWLVLRYVGDGGEGSLTFSSHDEPVALAPRP